jgi:hypothetical protein
MARVHRKTDKLRLWAILGLLVSLFWLLPGNQAQAEDRKTRTITFLSSGTYTAATGYSTGFDVSAYTEAQILVNVTAEGDVSTLDITVQVSDDNTTYYTHTAMTQITGTGQYRTAITNFGKYVRLKYVVGGTSFTFQAVGVLKN